MARNTFTQDLIPDNEIMEVVKFSKKTGLYVEMRLMKHGDFKVMKWQNGFRYQEFQKNYSQFHLK